MKNVGRFLVIALLGTVVSTALAADDKTPDATLKLSAGSVAAGIGFSWGSGTLTLNGKDHEFSVKGLSVGDVGVTKAEAAGKVYGLKSLKDFNGNYTAVGAGATVAGGGSVISMRNQNGVRIDLVTTTQGLKVTLGGGGVDLQLKE
jgi:hypothetical protein